MAASEGTLRERKMRRTRDAIVAAAFALFAERGFSEVTIADIAECAEVGRSTFFRYFADKPEVLFSGDEEARAALVEASTAEAASLAPLGDRLANAVLVARAGLLALAGQIESGATPAQLALRERLIDEQPELRARDLVKRRAYGAAGTEVMLRHGATATAARLAVSLAFACFDAATYNGYTGSLTDAIDEQFRRLASLDGPALGSALPNPAPPPLS